MSRSCREPVRCLAPGGRPAVAGAGGRARFLSESADGIRVYESHGSAWVGSLVHAAKEIVPARGHPSTGAGQTVTPGPDLEAARADEIPPGAR